MRNTVHEKRIQMIAVPMDRLLDRQMQIIEGLPGQDFDHAIDLL
jgi:hypothetical protein